MKIRNICLGLVLGLALRLGNIWGQNPIVRSPASMSQLGPLQITLTSSTVITLQAGVVMCGEVPVVVSGTTATISGSGTGVAYVYVNCDSSTLTLAVGALTVASAGFTVTAGTSVPRNAVYWAKVTATTGNWVSVDDYRNLATNKGLIQGNGVVLTDDGIGNTEIEIDTALVATLTQGTSVPGSCTISTQFFWDTDDTTLYHCNGSTYTAVGGGTDRIGICMNETDAWNPAASSTYYQGAYITPQATNNGLVRFPAPVTGTIVGVTVASYISTAAATGTTGTVVTVQKAGVDTAVAATLSMSAADNVASGTGSTAVNKNDMLNYKIVTPAYTTDPVGVRMRYCTIIQVSSL